MLRYPFRFGQQTATRKIVAIFVASVISEGF